nr:uncharacterized protein LOC106034406 [Anser cygnoides]XP_013034001.1 uncharacterized protein LOC106034406 [Anser cygnoides]XP_047920663.1 uncharacterized protein LOC106034406 [Anser cygnoides]
MGKGSFHSSTPLQGEGGEEEPTKSTDSSGGFSFGRRTPPASAQDPQPLTGHQQGGGTEGWEPCVAEVLRGDKGDVAAARGGDVQGSDWGRAAAAVLSGSSFPRNPLGALLGIPGNTVLGAMALHQEMARPRGEPRHPEEPGTRYGVMPGGWEWGWAPNRCGAAHSPAQEIPVPKDRGDDGCPLGSQPPAREHRWWPFILLLPFGALLEGWVSAGPRACHLATLAPIKVSAPSDSPGRFFGAGGSAGHTALWCHALAKGRLHPAGMGWRQRKGTDMAGSSRQQQAAWPGRNSRWQCCLGCSRQGCAALPACAAGAGAAPPFYPHPTQQQNHPHATREADGVPFPMPTGVTAPPQSPLPASPEMPASAVGCSSAPKSITGVPPMSPLSSARCSASSQGHHPTQSPTVSPALQPGPCCVPCTHGGSTPLSWGHPKTLTLLQEGHGWGNPSPMGRKSGNHKNLPGNSESKPKLFPAPPPPLSLQQHFWFGVAPSAPFQALPSSLFGSQLGEGG